MTLDYSFVTSGLIALLVEGYKNENCTWYRIRVVRRTWAPLPVVKLAGSHGHVPRLRRAVVEVTIILGNVVDIVEYKALVVVQLTRL